MTFAANRFPTVRVVMILFGVALVFTNLSYAQSSKPQPLHADGIENFFQLSDKVYSGSTPEGEKAFAELKKRGIKTIISVDGAKPDVETAKKFDLRYVH